MTKSRFCARCYATIIEPVTISDMVESTRKWHFGLLSASIVGGYDKGTRGKRRRIGGDEGEGWLNARLGQERRGRLPLVSELSELRRNAAVACEFDDSSV